MTKLVTRIRPLEAVRVEFTDEPDVTYIRESAFEGGLEFFVWMKTNVESCTSTLVEQDGDFEKAYQRVLKGGM